MNEFIKEFSNLELLEKFEILSYKKEYQHLNAISDYELDTRFNITKQELINRLSFNKKLGKKTK